MAAEYANRLENAKDDPDALASILEELSSDENLPNFKDTASELAGKIRNEDYNAADITEFIGTLRGQGGRRRHRRGKKTRKTRGRRRRGGSAKDVAESIISQLEPSAVEIPEDGKEEDETVTVSLPASETKAADIDELIRKLREYKDTTSVTGKAKAFASSAVSGLKSKFGSLFSKGQSAGAITQALEGYLNELKNKDSVVITAVPSALYEYVERLREVSAASGGKPRKSRRYTRRR